MQYVLNILELIAVCLNEMRINCVGKDNLKMLASSKNGPEKIKIKYNVGSYIRVRISINLPLFNGRFDR